MEYLIYSLQRLVPTQESMHTLSAYIAALAREHAAIAGAIELEFGKSSKYHRLNILYLINELVQSNRGAAACAKSGERQEALAALQGLLVALAARTFCAGLAQLDPDRDQALARKYRELRRVWVDRRLLSAQDLGAAPDAAFDFSALRAMADSRDKDGIIKYVADYARQQ